MSTGISVRHRQRVMSGPSYVSVFVFPAGLVDHKSSRLLRGVRSSLNLKNAVRMRALILLISRRDYAELISTIYTKHILLL